MSARNGSGSTEGSTRMPNVTFGCAVATTMPASTSSPDARVTPATWPPGMTRILATAAPVRISAPNERAAPARALVTPPIPPRGNPHAPAWPSTSPMWWCSVR